MITEEMMIDLVKKRIKGILTAGSFFAVNRAMIPFTKVDPKKVLFASDVRKEIGGNMKFVYDWLPKDKYRIVTDFKADRRIKRTLKQDLTLVYNMTTCHYMLLEDYFRYTSYMKVRKGQEIVQLWHGAGAYKKFGFSRANGDEGIKIHKGYRKYAKAIVSAEPIRKCYAEAFDIALKKVQATGVPRTDIFFDKEYIGNKREELYRDFPFLKDKKVILFAPTYRGTRAEDAAYDFDKIMPDKFCDALGDDYVFIFKWHPATYNNLKIEEKKAYDLEKYNGFFHDLSQARDINDLLLVTDVLITDYSSVIFDYLLTDKPIVYYTYDQKDYEGGRGIYFDFDTYVYGRVARDQDELIEAIKAGDMCEDKRETFRNRFMSACDGRSTEKTCEWIFNDKLEN